MNGSENGYAGALFFALISLGAILKIEDFTIGCAVGACGALFAAISLRQAFIKTAQAKEEDHQRMEIQFQQLRSKINETSSSNVTAMNSLNEAAQLLKDNLQIVSLNLATLDGLAGLIKNIESITLSVASLEENSSALNAEIEKISVAIESQEKLSATEEFKNLIAVEESNKKVLQTILKSLQLIRQVLGNPSYAKDLEKINSSVGSLAERIAAFDTLKISVDGAHEDLSELVKIAGELSKNLMTTLDDTQKNISEWVTINSELSKSLATTFDDTQRNISELVEINGELLKDLTTLDDAQKNVSELVEVNSGLSKDLTAALDDNQKNIVELIKTGNSALSKNLATTLYDLRLDVTKLSDKLDYLRKAQSENPLTEEDMDFLKKIMAKVNLK